MIWPRLRYIIGGILVVAIAILTRLPLSSIDLFADGRVYVRAALALQEHGSLELAPGPECPELSAPEPATCRLPGYSALLAVSAPWAKRADDFTLPARILNLLADLLTCWFIFRLFAALGVAVWLRFVAVLAVLLHPTILRFSFAGLTESVAMAITAGWLLLVVGGERLTTCRLALSGFVLGLAALLRADFLFLAPAMVTAWIIRAEGRRTIGALALALGCVSLPVGAWMMRNHARTQQWMSPFPSSCDLCGRRQTSAGAKAWLGTWLTREEEVPLDWSLIAGQPAPSVNAYPPQAFGSDAERKQVEGLFEARNRQGLTEAVDREFGRLASERWRSRPLATLAAQLERAAFLALTRSSAIFGDAHLFNKVPPQWKRAWPWTAGAFLLACCLGFFLAIAGDEIRRPAILCAVAILGRLAGVAWAGGVEQRYANEAWPLIIVGALLLVARVARALRPASQGEASAR